MDAGGTMRELLRSRPDAIVAAIDGNARMVPVPPSVELHGHPAFTGQSGMDLVVADDRIAVLDAWRRAQTESVVRSDVHLLADPDCTAPLWIFDLRAEHGVHVIVLEGQCLDAVHRSGEERDARRRIVARLAGCAAVGEAATTGRGTGIPILPGEAPGCQDHFDARWPTRCRYAAAQEFGAKSRGRHLVFAP